MKSEMRWCNDIGMFAFDRSIQESCVHATDFCKKTCFNVKLFKVYKNMHVKDVRNEAYWEQIDGKEVYNTLKRKKKQVKRGRFMTRGEAVSDYGDIDRIVDICVNNPDTDWWLPTRAWLNPLLRVMIESRLMPIKNLKISASLDPSNTIEDWDISDSWSTMYYGDDEQLTNPKTGKKMFKCPKTWGHVKGACETCKNGCFHGKGRVDVHLQAH